MEKNYQFLNMDINKPITRKLTAMQFDSKSRYILVSVFSNFMPYDLSNATVKIYGVKGDKKEFFNNAKIIDAKAGKFEIELTEQCLSAEGDVEIQILIVGVNGERLSSNSFILNVKKTIIDPLKIVSQNEWGALTEGLASLAEYDVYKNNIAANKNKLIEVDSQLTSLENQNYKIITPIMFGAIGDGLADDTDAIQRALNYFYENNCKLIIDREYRVLPKFLDDGSRVCIYLNDKSDKTHAWGNRGVIEFTNAGSIFTDSTKECTLFRFKASNIKVYNMMLKGVSEKTTLLEFSKLNKTDENEVDFICFNSFKNAKLLSCKCAISMEGQSFYNTFDTFTFINCSRVLWIKPSFLSLQNGTKSSNVNRNHFSNFVANVSNKQGIFLEYGDTNKFTNISFEGLTDWCIYVKDYRIEHPTWHYTEDNIFRNVTFEKCDKQIYNEVGDTQFHSVNFTYNACEFRKIPMVITNGLNYSYAPSSFYGFEKTTEDSFTVGAEKWSAVFTHHNGIGAKDFYDIDISEDRIIQNNNRKVQGFNLGNCENITNILYNGNGNGILTKSIGGVVFIQGKMKITPTSSDKDIKLHYPTGLNPNSMHLASWGNVDPFKNTIVCTNNDKDCICYAELTNSNIVIKKPDEGWSGTVMLHLNLIYFREIQN